MRNSWMEGAFKNVDKSLPENTSLVNNVHRIKNNS